MPSQKDMETSASVESAKPATPPTHTSSVTPAAGATTSKPAPSAPSAPSINPATGVQFKDDCIVLILGPKGTVHPMIDPKSPTGVRVFEDAEAALAQVSASKVASSRPFAIIALKGLF